MKTLYRRKKIFRKLYHLLCFLLRLSKLKILLIIVTNVIFVRIFLYLTLNSNVTGRVCNIRGKLTCNSPNVVYLISCSNCDDQYVGHALHFKSRFRIHKSDVKTKKDRCVTARHFNTKCTDSSNPHKFLKIQIIESAQCDYNQEGKLWERERYWQSQLFTNPHGMSSVSDLYSSKRRGCRKK